MNNKHVAHTPQWTQVLNAVETLQQTMSALEVFQRHPAIGHDYLGLLEALAGLEQNEPLVNYWRAKRAKLVALYPNLKEGGVRPSPLSAKHPIIYSKPDEA